MKKINLALLLGAAVGVVLAACGDLGGGGGTGGGTGGGSGAFCSSTNPCTNSGDVCQHTTGTCAPKCTATTGCTASQTCDTATGQCNAGGTPDGGGGTVSCTYRSCQGSGEFCNASNKCEVKACNGAASAIEPDVCGYANYCAADNKCYNTDAPTCASFTTSGHTPTFNPTTSTGPIIYFIEDMNKDDTAACTSSQYAYSMTIYGYRTDTDWPAASTALPGFKYVNSAGTEISVTTFMRPSNYKHTGKNATFLVTLCSDSVTSNLTGGFYFTGGNEACGLATTPDQP